MARNKQIIGLDGLRFMAAVMVLLFHLGFWNWTRAENYHGPLSLAYAGFTPVSWFGWVGVEVFFVLSGFVIAYSAQRTPAVLFFQHRLTRLLPAAVVCSSLTAVVFLVLKKTAISKALLLWLKSVTFFPIGPWIDNAYWTLDVEIAFYAVILVLLVFKRFDWMPAVMACVGSLSTAFWIIAFFPESWRISIVLQPLIAGLETHVTLNMLLLRHGCYFATGAYLWLCLYSPAANGRGWTPARIAVILIGAIGGVLQIVFRAGVLGDVAGYSSSPALPAILWLASLVFIVVAVEKNDAIHALIGTLGASLLRRLGLMTYPLYLMHQGIGVLLIRLFSTYLGAMQSWMLSVAIILSLAYLVSTYAEPVLQKLLKRCFARMPALERVPVIAGR